MMKKNSLSLLSTMKFSYYHQHHHQHSKYFSVLIDYYQKVQLPLTIIPPKITIIGSGNFGTAIARRIALNIEEHYKLSNKSINSSSIDVVGNDSSHNNSNDSTSNNNDNYEVKMWIYDEMINGKLLSTIINNDRINIKYLPNVILPPIIKVYSDLIEATYDADILIFVVSKKYLRDILKAMKGLDFTPKGPHLLSDYIRNDLNLSNMVVMMGANIATDIAYDKLVESTVASNDLLIAKQIATLFQCHVFRTELSTDISTVEFCGAFKHVISIGAGLCDGMGLGSSTRAALMRQGLQEMALFCKIFDYNSSYQFETLFKSCGIADIIASCSGGRNRLCSEAFASRIIAQSNDKFFGNSQTLKQTSFNVLPSGQPIPKDPWQNVEDAATELWEDIELELLNGQKLQGIYTCKEIVQCLESVGYGYETGQFPLIHRIHRITCLGEDINTLFDWNLPANKL